MTKRRILAATAAYFVITGGLAVSSLAAVGGIVTVPLIGFIVAGSLLAAHIVSGARVAGLIAVGVTVGHRLSRRPQGR